MDKSRIEGAAKELKGTIKEAAGKLTGNKKLDVGLHAELSRLGA